jgi:aspartate aminotransferase
MTMAEIVLAARMREIRLSPTMKAAAEAERLKAAGVDVVDLGAGEPDFPTPAHIAAAAHAALDQQFTKYTANAGTRDARAAVAFRLREDAQVTYDPDEVILTAGGKQALFHAAMALFGPGDEVITHAPGWPTLGEQIRIAGAMPVIVQTEAREGFALTAQRLLAAVTPRTRGLVLNSPTNPTGALMAEREASRLAAEAARRGLWVILDLCYDRIIYDGASHELPRIFGEAMRDRLVLCGSASKTYAMTGWRCGWLAAARPVVQAAGALQSHESSNANSLAQKALVAALTGPQDVVTAMVAEYQRRRDHALTWLGEEPGLSCVVPRGAFYLFPSVTAYLSERRYRTSLDFADALLREAHVVTTAGEGFGAPGFLRLSFATSLDRLQEGIGRLVRFARGAR